MPAEEPTIDSLRVIAKQAGMELTDDELKNVLPGVLRNWTMAQTVRKWAGAGVEPSTASVAPRSQS